MTMSSMFHDNADVPHNSGILTHPYEGYIAANYKNINQPTQTNPGDLKPTCYTRSKKTDDIVQNFLPSQTQKEQRLAQTVSDRTDLDEKNFVGRRFDD